MPKLKIQSKPKPKPKPTIYRPPSYKNQIWRSDYEGNDQSSTDFKYALALLRRGHSEDEVKGRLLNEREDWTNHKGGNRQEHYLTETVRNAKRIISG